MTFSRFVFAMKKYSYSMNVSQNSLYHTLLLDLV